MEGQRNLNLRNVILGNPSRLRFVIRFSNCPRIHNESVAEHSFYTAFYAQMIAVALSEEGIFLNIASVVGKALLHDLDECYSGDFIRMFKHSNVELKNQIDLACGRFMGILAQEMSNVERVQQDVFQKWFGSKQNDEGAVVAFADYLSVLSYIHQEIDLGNHRMERQLPELVKFHESFYQDKYAFLKSYVDMAGEILNEIQRSVKERK